jgi:hypothetical protein
MKQSIACIVLVLVLTQACGAQATTDPPYKHWVIQPAADGVYTGVDGGPKSNEGSCEGVTRAVGQTMQVCDRYYTIFDLPSMINDERTTSISAEGTIPVLTLGCAGNGTPDSGGRVTYRAIASGAFDEALRRDAAALKRYAAQFPKTPWVMIRPFHEFNVNIGNPPNHPNKNNCFSTPEGLSDMQSEFKAAFRHVVSYLEANGAINATWLWCPAIGPRVWRRFGGDQLADFYPGSDYVDWVCIDTYDTPAPGGGLANAFRNVGFFKQFHKPIIVAETAECNSERPLPKCGGYGHTQAEYINDLRREMQPGGRLADAGVKAWMYFDQDVPFTGESWSFDSQGLAAFKAMINTPYFHPPIPHPVMSQ